MRKEIESARQRGSEETEMNEQGESEVIGWVMEQRRTTGESDGRLKTHLCRRPRPHRYPLLIGQQSEQIVRRSLERSLDFHQRPIYLLRLFLLFWRWSRGRSGCRCTRGCGGACAGCSSSAGGSGADRRGRRRSTRRIRRRGDHDVLSVNINERDREFFEFDFERCGEG